MTYISQIFIEGSLGKSRLVRKTLASIKKTGAYSKDDLKQVSKEVKQSSKDHNLYLKNSSKSVQKAVKDSDREMIGKGRVRGVI